MIINTDYKIEKACSKDETRAVLTNVYIDKEAGKAIATNGRMMAMVPVDLDDTDTGGYVTPAALKEYRAQNKKAFVPFELNGSQKIGGVSMDRPTEEVIGKYPHWKQVLPKDDDKPVFEIGLNASMLKDLANAIGSEGEVKLTFYGPLKVVKVTTSKGEGVLMPIRL